jgi:hypothetical protein
VLPATASGTYLVRHVRCAVWRAAARRRRAVRSAFMWLRTRVSVIAAGRDGVLDGGRHRVSSTEAGTIERAHARAPWRRRRLSPARTARAEESVVYFITAEQRARRGERRAFPAALDGEDDVALRARVLHSYRACERGERRYFESWVWTSLRRAVPCCRGSAGGNSGRDLLPPSGIPDCGGDQRRAGFSWTASGRSAWTCGQCADRAGGRHRLRDRTEDARISMRCRARQTRAAAYFNGSLLGAPSTGKVGAILLAVGGRRNCTLNERRQISARRRSSCRRWTLTIGEAV